MTVYEHHIATKNKQQMSKITEIVCSDVKKSGIKDGLVVVYSPHTTAGLTINENADPDVVRDMLSGFEKIFPTYAEYYRHMEGNYHAQIKTSLTGVSQTLILDQGDLILGRWQDLYFCEFDGPRNRRFYVKILEG